MGTWGLDNIFFLPVFKLIVWLFRKVSIAQNSVKRWFPEALATWIGDQRENKNIIRRIKASFYPNQPKIIIACHVYKFREPKSGEQKTVLTVLKFSLIK